MRFFCFTLVVLTLLLSSSPCCAGDECCNETSAACSENTEDKHHSESPTNSCSPFMVCGSCTGFMVIAVNPDLNSEAVMTEDMKITYIQEYLDYYYLKFWQPPKIS
ncbi:MAG: hypothetical protein Q8R96_12210 [Bacteroidota bacterium]|nr:hypothetical protein [Bacteroidota bacterium]